MKIHKDIVQGTDEWFDLRKCKLTGSHATAIGNQGAGLKTYIDEIILNMFIEKKHYTNDDIERGNELEHIARINYEFEYSIEVKEVGFIEYTKYSGGSTDGLVGDDGIIEIKARNDKIHFNLLKTGKVDSSTIWQMQFYILITGREWCDFISYNPNFKQSMFIKRILPDEIMQEKLKTGIEKGTEMLKELLNSEFVKKELKK